MADCVADEGLEGPALAGCGATGRSSAIVRAPKDAGGLIDRPGREEMVDCDPKPPRPPFRPSPLFPPFLLRWGDVDLSP